jgi:hypothetical protein
MIILLVVLALIFLITVGMGGCNHGGGRTPSDAGAVKSLKGLQGNRFLTIGDKAFVSTDGCWDGRAPQILTVNPQCFVILQKRAFFRKSTRVVFRRCIDPPRCQLPAPFPSFRVTVNPRNGPQRTDDVTGKFCYGTAIDHGGGALTLLGTATIELQQQGCPG